MSIGVNFSNLCNPKNSHLEKTYKYMILCNPHLKNIVFNNLRLKKLCGFTQTSSFGNSHLENWCEYTILSNLHINYS